VRCQGLADRYSKRTGSPIPEITNYPIDPYEYTEGTQQKFKPGRTSGAAVIADFSRKDKITAASLFGLGYHYSVPLDKWNISDVAVTLFIGHPDP